MKQHAHGLIFTNFAKSLAASGESDWLAHRKLGFGADFRFRSGQTELSTEISEHRYKHLKLYNRTLLYLKYTWL